MILFIKFFQIFAVMQALRPNFQIWKFCVGSYFFSHKAVKFFLVLAVAD